MPERILCVLAFSVAEATLPRAIVRGRRERPDPALFAGKGKVEEVAQTLAATGANLAIFNHDLSPVQERNLERALAEVRAVRGGLDGFDVAVPVSPIDDPGLIEVPGVTWAMHSAAPVEPLADILEWAAEGPPS